MCNIYRNDKKRPKPYLPSDFIPGLQVDDDDVDANEGLFNHLRALAKNG